MKALDELKKAFLKTGAKVTSFDIPYEVGLSMTTEKDKWESSGAKPVMRTFVPEGADEEEVYKAGYAYLGALVKETAGEQMKKIIAHRKKAVASIERDNSSSHTQLHVPEPTRVKLTPDGNEVDEYLVDSILVEYTPGGQKRAKVKGGKWKKYGVVCWPEVLEEIDFDLDASDAADFPQQPGLTAIALMIEGKPKKVIGFK